MKFTPLVRRATNGPVVHLVAHRQLNVASPVECRLRSDSGPRPGVQWVPLCKFTPGFRVQALSLLQNTVFLRRSPLDSPLTSSRRQSCVLAPRNASWLLVTPWIPRGYTFVWRMKDGRGHARTGHVENWRRSSRRPCHSSMSLEARAQTPRFNIRAEAQSTVLVARR
jgi:hypothetical protein